MKKILGLTVAALMVMGLIGGGTWAYFSDPEVINSNVFQAGTIDLHVDGQNTWSGTLGWTDAKPGVTDTLTFSNNGTLSGNFTIAIGGLSGLAESDDDTKDGTAAFEFSATNDASAFEMSDAQYASLIKVTDDKGIITSIAGAADNGTDGFVSLGELYDYNQTTAIYYNMPVDDVVVFTFELFDTFDKGGAYTTDNMSGYLDNYDLHVGLAQWNVPQADGVTLDITVSLVQQ